MNRKLLITLVAGVAAATAACDQDTPLQPGAEARVGSAASSAAGPELPFESTSAVYWFADGSEVDDATARLVRSADAIRTRTHTTGLDPGHVMTMWWVVFNHPEHCQHGAGGMACGEGDLFDGPYGPTGVEPACVYTDGSIVGGNGNARFNDRLRIGESRDSCIDFFVDLVPGLKGQDHGLTNPAGAEVHLVVRSHGPRIPGQIGEQRSTFAGGCIDFLDPGAEHELEPGECSDLQFAVFPADG
jgi:hypothetical protein